MSNVFLKHHQTTLLRVPSEVPKVHIVYSPPLFPVSKWMLDDLFISVEAKCHLNVVIETLDSLSSLKHKIQNTYRSGVEREEDKKRPSKAVKQNGMEKWACHSYNMVVWRHSCRDQSGRQQRGNFHVRKYVFQIFFSARNCQYDKETAVGLQRVTSCLLNISLQSGLPKGTISR